MKKSTFISLSAWLLAVPVLAGDLPIEVVTVKGYANPNSEEILHSQNTNSTPVHDAGELLRVINGIAATRRGGRGFEPIIRGQSQNQLNILTDGAYTFGGCPGRMDPPTTYTAMENFDSLTVIKGHRSVIYGAGGTGGTLLFEHKRPDLSKKAVLGSVNLGYTSNSNVNASSANFAAGNKKGFFRIFGDVKNSDNYQDGEGNETASKFDSNSLGVIIGGDITQQHYLQVSYEGVREDDIWYDGNGMDSPWTDSDTYRFRWQYSGNHMFDNVELNAYESRVNHLMDNYRVRNRMPLNNNGVAAPTSSDTYGGRLLAAIESGVQAWRFGVDYRANERDAILFIDQGKDGTYDMLASLLWPGVEQYNSGIFAELDHQLNKKNVLRFGGRVDVFTSEATRAGEPVGMMGSATPNTLYENVYGSVAEKYEQTSASGVIGWDRSFESNRVFSANLSHSVRSPDATEQFIARSIMGTLWVGNPNIKQEKHNQLDLTFISSQTHKRWSATAFWDEVSDYIERYKREGGTYYRNVDAQIYGIELEGMRRFGKHWSADAALSYTRGKSDEGDLAQIMPLQLLFSVNYTKQNWQFGGEWIANAEQDHFNASIDPGETDSFTVFNMYARWTPLKSLRFQAGVENIFDEIYAYHVNSANSDPFNPEPVRVNEPGRQLWLKVRYKF